MTENESQRLNVLALAPTTTNPPMIGDAKRAHRIARALLRSGISTVYVGKNFVFRSGETVESSNQHFHLGRNLYGLKALLKGGHYNEQKHCTRRWLNYVRPFLEDEQFNLLYCHFVFTVPTILELVRGRPMVVDTHNSEWQWYGSFATSTRNPLIRRVCKTSSRRASAIVEHLPSNVIMAHVSESDLNAYRERRPDLTHIVAPNGGDIECRVVHPDYTASRKRLLFFASLHGKMSYDALKHFQDRFWSELKDVSEVVVAGANPSRGVLRLCSNNGWTLQANLTEQQVTHIFEEAHFSILPFAYGAGSKLKFFDACARGVPVLSTIAGACGQASTPKFVTISDDPTVWRQEIQGRKSLDADWIDQVHTFGQEFSWEAIVARLIPVMQRAVAPSDSNLMEAQVVMETTGGPRSMSN